jgi:hypothetical protein
MKRAGHVRAHRSHRAGHQRILQTGARSVSSSVASTLATATSPPYPGRGRLEEQGFHFGEQLRQHSTRFAPELQGGCSPRHGGGPPLPVGPPAGRTRPAAPGQESSSAFCAEGGVAPPEGVAGPASPGRLFQARWSAIACPACRRPGTTPPTAVPPACRACYSRRSREPSPSQVVP